MRNNEQNSRTRKESGTLAVIGGGPSGLFAAITAAAEAKKTGDRPVIRVYDKNEKPARKILVSGNGRCNLSNVSVSAGHYPGVEARWFDTVYGQLSNEALSAFFRENGLLLKTDAAGRVYPMSGQASAVQDLLLFLCAAAGVVIVPGTEIVSVERKGGGYLLNGSIAADRVIFACGSAAAPRNGGKDSLRLINALGVETTPFLPALAPIKIRQFSKNQLKGVRAEGEISVWVSGECIAKDRGELQYTEYGLSGIPAMQVSGEAAKAAAAGAVPEIRVDSLPGTDEQALLRHFDKGAVSVPEMPVLTFLSGMFPRRLAGFFIRQGGISPETAVGALPASWKRRIIQSVKRCSYPFESVCGFAEAQVASGGVPAAALDPCTLELTGAPGCFVCGEMADVVGECGGYNLQWAWSSGFVAGKHAARRKYVDPDQ